jgi:hypothetical protein
LEAGLKISFSIKDFASIQTQFNRAVVDQLKATLGLAAPSIKERVSNIVAEAVNSCPEVESMRGGGKPNLKAEFGFIAPEVFIRSLTDGIKRLVFTRVTLSLRGNNAAGGLQVGLEDFDRLLIDPAVKSVYESEGGSVEWLRWLLEEDSNIIIADYDIIYGGFNQSRSKQALMKEGIGSYQIPSEFAGNPSNNFLTRAITPQVEEQIRATIAAEIQGRIG